MSTICWYTVQVNVRKELRPSACAAITLGLASISRGNPNRFATACAATATHTDLVLMYTTDAKTPKRYVKEACSRNH